MKDSRLQQAINDATNPVFAKGYSAVKEAYREQYGEKKWIGKYVEALGLRTPGVKAKDDKPYLAARRSIERFEKGKAKSSVYTAGADKAGQQVPPVGRELKPGQTSITIVVKGDMHQGPKGGTEPLTPKATFSGNDAIMFINDPSYEAIYDDYGMGDDLLTDGDYVLDVTSVSAG